MLLIKRHTLLICAAKGNSEKLLGNLIFFECKKILQSFSIIIKIFRRPKEGRKNVLLRGQKRGGIRETVGFEERSGKRNDGRRIGGWCVAWGAVGWRDT